ncbi:MAG TPA: hypothetical protein VK932_16560 [Kofleriaceae bacterium]|nr:hypothetical protein [Kofleriaceae bacterium]
MRSSAIAACMLVACTGLVRAEGLSPADLARTSARGHLTGVPLVANSVDFGFGAGARGYYFERPYRIRSAIVLARNTAASYHGSGEAGRTLRLPGSPEAFSRYDDHRDALRRVDARTGMAYTEYGAFDALRPSFLFGRIRDDAGARIEAR